MLFRAGRGGGDDGMEGEGGEEARQKRDEKYWGVCHAYFFATVITGEMVEGYTTKPVVFNLSVRS